MIAKESFLFVGLGNPGARYALTRHNLGFMVVAGLAARLEWTFKEVHHVHALVAKGVYENCIVHLMQPYTYMNLSGSAVESYLHYFKIPVDHLLVVCDDVDLPYGKLRLRAMGSAGGHNGLKSIEECLGTPNYKRLKMGIGRPEKEILADYVLESFTPTEQEELSGIIGRSAEVLQRVLKESFSDVMTAVNQ